MNARIAPPSSSGLRPTFPPRRQESGSAVIIVFVVVTILLSLLMSNVRTVRALDRELRLVERRQISRWLNAKPAPPPVQIPADGKTQGPDSLKKLGDSPAARQ